MGDSTGGDRDAGSEGFARPDRGFGPAREYGPERGSGSDRVSETDQRFGFPTPPSVPPHTGPMYPVVHSGYYGPPMPGRQTSGMAVTGLVLGVLSLLLFWTPLGPVLTVAGIVFSSIGMSQSSKPERSGMGMAVTGLACSLASAAIWMAIGLLIAALLW